VVFHVIIWEYQPVRRDGTAGPDEVFVERDTHEVVKADRRKSLDGDRNGKLRRDGSFNRRMVLSQARLPHQCFRQRNHFAPNAFGQHLPNERQIFGRQPFAPMLLKTSPYVIETLKCGLVQAPGRLGHSQELPT
jgi:hypothetical protein